MKPLYGLFTIACLCIYIGCLHGCRSVSHTEQYGSKHTESSYREQIAQNHSADSATTALQKHDSITAAAIDRGIVTIQRDSTGLPLSITWCRTSTFDAHRNATTREERTDATFSMATSSSAADSVAVTTAKATKTKRETDIGIPLEMRISIGIILFLIIFYLSDYIYRKWEQKKRQ